MPPTPSLNAPVAVLSPGAEVLAAYAEYVGDFLEVTGRARQRFLDRDWHGAQADAAERLELYTRHLQGAIDRLSARGEADGAGWKREFAALVEGRPDAALARTFFNSVVRRVLDTVGVSPATEFTADPPEPPRGDGEPLVCAVASGGLDASHIERVLRACELSEHFAALPDDAARVAAAVRAQLGGDLEAFGAIEWLPFLFYRNKAAYLVARLARQREAPVPLLVPLVHAPEGVRPDAVITERDEVHRVFSFARSYFHAYTDRPCETVAFLRTLMPAKPIHELYISIGHNRHAKTELYRELATALAAPGSRLEHAEGIPGLVMIVFTLPHMPVVFKVIRDRFGPSKEVSRNEVMEKYRFVFVRDRVGRLADAQEFEHLEIARDRFQPALLEDLLAEAGSTVELRGDRVHIRHLYTERRLRPLDLFLRESPAAAAEAAVIEYGNAIRDLACANLFPGDLLLKNFGVTRHGRVVFYDYDEIALLTDMRFRSLPTARSDDDEMSAEPWFSVDPHDVFPEQFLPFLIPPGPLREAFLREHGEILTPAFWRNMQARQQAQEIPDFYPYPQSRRLSWV
jgi:isocitrate dehydrogenase kinase/phosphatase